MTKARTLKNLRERFIKKDFKDAKVLDLYIFYAKNYLNNKEKILKDILGIFNEDMIVRSSSLNEDTNFSSNAGGFDSVLAVKANSKDLDLAIQKVISSYENLNDKDEIFVQPMLKSVSMAGVVFTADIDTLAPYYIVNYDESGSTDSVTSGKDNNLKTFICLKNKIALLKDKRLSKLLKVCEFLQDLFTNEFLDIEFAFSNDELYIFQVRNIVIKDKVLKQNLNIEDSLTKLYKKIQKLNKEHLGVLGDKAIFGVMPDWNPAEIIGLRPRNLSLSIYKELITDNVWAYQRDNYAYRNLRSNPLLISFMGLPYIDVRVSFNSFVPKDLNELISKKLINYYLNELNSNKDKHDKVEFDIVYSCYYFGISNKLKKLLSFSFNENELKRIEFSLLNLTNNLIKNSLHKKDITRSAILEEKYEQIINLDISLVDKIYWLNEYIKRYGTLPFAGVARSAFIAMQFLNSMLNEGIFTKDDYSKFLKSLNTVSKQLSKDIHILNKKDFLEKYGHLRPGTYDILSKRYDQNYDEYFSETNDFIEENDFVFTKEQIDKIEILLIENGLEIDFNTFISFIKEAIEGREYVKFVFTKALSRILEYIKDLGAKLGFDRDDLSYLDYKQVLNLYSSLNHMDLKEIFSNNIKLNKDLYEYTKVLKLPSLITKEEDVFMFFMQKEEANFIGLKTIKAKLVLEENIHKEDLKGKIICIKSADPGYDFLFSKNIAGLITCFGGANSHMAIRCAELGIVAIIGCGEERFNEYSKAKVISIDALNKKVIC